MKKIKLFTSFVLMTITSLSTNVVWSRSLDDIKRSGSIVVAVKADYKPYGYMTADGKHVGLEIDLANDVAKRLGVDAKFISVSSKTRMDVIKNGEADLMIATMTDRPDRRKIVYTIEPNYYSSGTNIISPKSKPLKSWTSIRDQLICGTQGSYYNEFIQSTFGAKVIEFDGTDAALEGLKSGKCVGFVFDDSFILSKLTESEWSTHYEMSLDTIEDAPWGMAVKHGYQDLYQFISDTVIEWHKTGYILSLETKHGISNTPFAKKMNLFFNN